MPYKGPRPCECGYRNFVLVRRAESTSLVRCKQCGKEKRISNNRFWRGKVEMPEENKP